MVEPHDGHQEPTGCAPAATGAHTRSAPGSSLERAFHGAVPFEDDARIHRTAPRPRYDDCPELGELVAQSSFGVNALHPWFRRLVGTLALMAAFGGEAAAQERPTRFAIEVEGGATWQSYNDVRIPNNAEGTPLSLRDLAGSGPWMSQRAYLSWRLAERHEVRLLLAPFSLTETGVSQAPLSFAGEDYLAGQPLRATYTFNSYRVSYRRRVLDGERTTAWIGLTAKIRDAVIALEQGGTSSRKDDLGFVPLFHLAGTWRLSPQWHLGLDADVIAGGPGRAEDVAVKLGRDLGRGWTLAAGYRMVEGGADVESVYTFAWLHSAVVSIRRTW